VSVECGKRETILKADGPVFDGLKGTRSWIASGDRLVGPGGAAGLAGILQALRHRKQVR